MKILMVLTSHDQLGNTGKKTGFWLEEFAAPYYVFKDAGAQVVLASPKGGQPPLDPRSDEADTQTEATRRFKQDTAAQAALAHTVKLSDVSGQGVDALFYPGGHGPLWDLAEDTDSIKLIESISAAGNTVAAVCHAPGVLRHAKAADGSPLVKGKKVTGFTNSEEAAVQLTKVVPFLVEDILVERGGVYSKGGDWQSYVVTDGKLITGQNPASSAEAARAVLAQLQAPEPISPPEAPVPGSPPPPGPDVVPPEIDDPSPFENPVPVREPPAPPPPAVAASQRRSNRDRACRTPANPTT